MVNIKIFKNGQEIGEIDRLIKINGKLVIIEVKTATSETIQKSLISFEKQQERKLLSVEELTGVKPEFLLLHSSDVKLTEDTKNILKEMNKNGYYANSDNYRLTKQSIEDKARSANNIKDDIILEDLEKRKFLPIESIYETKPEFLLLHPSNMVLTRETVEVLKEATKKGYVSNFDNFRVTLEFLDNKETEIIRRGKP